MSVMYVDRPIRGNCWNLRDSYGEICVGCGCCSKDKKERHKARLETVKQWNEENDRFDRWSDDPDIRKLQEKNVKANRKYFARRIRYYERKVREDEPGANSNH